MAAWPGTLPSQMQPGAQVSRQMGFLRSQTDIGPGKQRRRFTAVSRYYAGTMVLTNAQKATFETFYQTTIKQGADTFDFADPDDFTTVSARFAAPPELTGLVGGASGVEVWRLQLELELLP